MKVNELFYSIQGESYHAGRPCTFVRLAGCNLRCTYCDTTYAYEEGEDYTIERVVKSVSSFGCRLVEITGGEPLLQNECPELARALLDNGHTVLVETNGSMDIRVLPAGAVCIMDMKCPSSGMSEHMNMDNLYALKSDDELKFVIQNRTDYEWATAIVRHLEPGKCRVSFSPVHRVLSPAILASWMLEDRCDIRLQLQVHRYIWPDSDRGR